MFARDLHANTLPEVSSDGCERTPDRWTASARACRTDRLDTQREKNHLNRNSRSFRLESFQSFCFKRQRVKRVSQKTTFNQSCLKNLLPKKPNPETRHCKKIVYVHRLKAFLINGPPKVLLGRYLIGIPCHYSDGVSIT